MPNTKLLFLLSIILVFGCGNDQSSTINSNSVSKEKIYNWRLASSFPKSLDSFWETLEDFSARVDDLTNGHVKIKLYQPKELVPALEVFNAVEQGSVEMGYSAGVYYMGKNQAFGLDSGLPFGLLPRQQNAWLYEGGGIELFQDLYKKHNIMYLPGGNTGTQMGGWFKKELKSLNDLKGLRMRIPGLGAKVMSELGVSVQLIGAGETYSALEQGTIDAAEFIGPYDDKKMGLYKVADFYYSPGWWETSTTVSFYINLEEWESLPPQYKKAIEYSAKLANFEMLNKYDTRNAKALNELVNNNGVKLRTYSDELLTRAKSITNDLVENYRKEEDFNKIYSSLIKSKETSMEWYMSNEFNLIQFEELE